MKNFIDKTVDFGASDMAMTPEEIAPAFRAAPNFFR